MQPGHLKVPLLKKELAGSKYLIFYADTSGSRYPFRAGKYATVSISSGAGKEMDLKRIFSISSPPWESSFLRFATIIREGSAFKEKLLEMEAGETLDISPPLGGFFLISDRKRPVVFITSEIGITPVASILAQEAEEGSDREMCLLYANASSEDELFSEEIECLRESLANLNIARLASLEYVENPRETYSLEKLKSAFPGCDINAAMFYVSGKPKFVNEARRVLLNGGIGSASIKTERFSGY